MTDPNSYDGKILTSDSDFNTNMLFTIFVDVEHLKADGLLTTGLIQEFNKRYVKINDKLYKRNSYLFISRPDK